MNDREHLALIHTLPCERWLPIPEWEGLYEVSDAGRVRSLDRHLDQPKNGTHIYLGRLLTPVFRGRYWAVTLAKDGRRVSRYIHRLVLVAFRGYPLIGQEACHGNGTRSDNRLCNLRWDSRKENHHDKVKHGTMPMGEKHMNAKLTDEGVREIRKNKKSAHQISKETGISLMTISRARRGITWRHVK